MRHTRVRSLVCALGLVLTASAVNGCAADATTPSSEEDITSKEAAAGMNLTTLIDTQAASPESAKQLGLKRWSLYALTTKGFSGLVGFAEDAAGDVRYAVTIDPGTPETKGTISVTTYNKKGLDANAPPVTDPVFRQLLSDLIPIQKRIEQKTAAHTRTCTTPDYAGGTTLAELMAAGLLLAGVGGVISLNVSVYGAGTVIATVLAGWPVYLAMGVIAVGVVTYTHFTAPPATADTTKFRQTCPTK